MSDQTNRNWPEGFTEQQIRRVSRRLLLWNGIIVGLVAIVVWLLWSYLGWFFHGPELVDDAFILDAAKGPTRSLIAYVELRDRRAGSDRLCRGIDEYPAVAADGAGMTPFRGMLSFQPALVLPLPTYIRSTRLAFNSR